MLFIQPTREAAAEPLIDELTMRMTSALRRAPAAELDAVRELPDGADMPSRRELSAPEYRVRREPATLYWQVREQIQEEVDEGTEAVRWSYELVLDNRSRREAHVQSTCRRSTAGTTANDR